MTTETVELPELPASQAYVDIWDSEGARLARANATYFTADQMREYALLAVKAERERCTLIADRWRNTTNKAPVEEIIAAIRKG